MGNADLVVIINGEAILVKGDSYAGHWNNGVKRAIKIFEERWEWMRKNVEKPVEVFGMEIIKSIQVYALELGDKID